MAQVIVSPKYQIVIPKSVRKVFLLKAGQKMTLLAKGGMIVLVPEMPLKSYRGMAKGVVAQNLREKQDRV